MLIRLQLSDRLVFCINQSCSDWLVFHPGASWDDMISGLTAASITFDVLGTSAASQVRAGHLNGMVITKDYL